MLGVMEGSTALIGMEVLLFIVPHTWMKAMNETMMVMEAMNETIMVMEAMNETMMAMKKMNETMMAMNETMMVMER